MRLSIRKLMLFTAGVAVILAMALALTRDYRRRLRLQAELLTAGAVYASVTNDGTSVVFANPISTDTAPHLKTARRIELKRVHVNRETLVVLSSLRELDSLMFQSCTFENEEDLAELSSARSSTIHFWNSSVSDDGIKQLAGATQLTSLTLVNTQVTQAGVEQLLASKPGLQVVRQPRMGAGSLVD